MSTPDEFPRDPEQARTDIELTRQELGETAQALAYKLNVPARAKEQLQHGTTKVKETVQHNPVPVIATGAVAALAVGGVITWRIRR
ncbi:DUF3618 domain-containing protein [Prauserella muralis]|uniref:Uncharacterized protein n=1 Tax=Prauserella muralis TaxID=588067 RepID=A0A2V4AZ87_9PSEU|nr:DUF3618 domain-containing protein [Prauserella muralis]PXY27331.1 hypothetical protein BAY60_12870 [Prauserella muralis]TWE22987.1 uncharacterized protein DUF3618 [Prauserella muralis]